MLCSSSSSVLWLNAFACWCCIILAARVQFAQTKRLLNYNKQYDVLVVATCEAKCLILLQEEQQQQQQQEQQSHKQLDNKHTCLKRCLTRGFDKRGSCPTDHLVDDDAPFDERVCPSYRQLSSSSSSPSNIDCHIDSECNGISKCCRHRCGATCQTPLHLQHAQDVPEIPIDVTISTRHRRGKSVTIRWTIPNWHNNTLYVIEERHHPTSEWTPCYRTSRTSAVLRHVIKPGRRYQFRVAAINPNGTKGYSKPANYVEKIGYDMTCAAHKPGAFSNACGANYTYQVNFRPKRPKAPTNVFTSPLFYHNGSFHTQLSWTQPQSDLPLTKYKVFWSRRLYGPSALDAVLVQQKTIDGDQNRFMIHNLEPNSLYFLQVQGLAAYGNNLLRGEKSGLVLNTTNYQNATSNASNLIELDKLFWAHGILKARVSWKSQHKSNKYIINWRMVSCKNEEKSYSTQKRTAVVKGSHFDVFDLQFDCRYHITIREVHKKPFDTFVTFITPSCRQLQLKNKKLKCKRSLQ